MAGAVSVANADSMSVLVKRVMVKGDDRAEGVLSVGDPAARMVSKITKSNAPVRFEIVTVKRFRQEGCRRIRMAFSQDLGKGKIFRTPPSEINLCSDGTVPLEGVDLDALARERGF